MLYTVRSPCEMRLEWPPRKYVPPSILELGQRGEFRQRRKEAVGVEILRLRCKVEACSQDEVAREGVCISVQEKIGEHT